MSRSFASGVLLAACVAMGFPKTHAQVRRLAELTAPELAQLDKSKTVVLLPGGILEAHGPYLPTFTDGYWNERVTAQLAEAVAQRPGYTAVVFPTLPLGNSAANDIGGRFHASGSFPVRFETLRDVLLDLATELGEQGFQWVFVVHGHGAPNHHRALDLAGDYFRETYGGHFVNLTGLLPVISAWDGEKTAAERGVDGLPIHAGLDETSMMLALHPELVRPGYVTATAATGQTMREIIAQARRPDWPGYFGAPALATVAHYTTGWQRAADAAVALALEILDGKDERKLPRFSREMAKSNLDLMLDRASLGHETRTRQRQEAWLKKQPPLPGMNSRK